MHRTIILGVVAMLYYSLAFYTLYTFEAQILVTSVVLFGFPAFLLAHFSSAPASLLIAVASLGGGLALILEGVAHIYGLWFTVGVNTIKVFGLVPIEAIIALVMQVLFLVLLYEVLFDDGRYTESSIYTRFGGLIIFALSAVLLLLMIDEVTRYYFIENSYMVIIIGLLGGTFLLLTLQRVFTIRLLDRFINFTLIASIPVGINLMLATVNTHKVFGYLDEYVHTFYVFGEIIPLEELILAFSLPLFVAVVYELYLDDTA